ncbi:hypothetical protein CONPUDRAFT_93215 [Coniophora puteana RWD-64-598 SS2]|uniref:ER transporter 6TM N-terminal domain-containing protein n=1 Tax=Coniophora puteana (strain RWD-64-598) TaxID=741705 RepID=A0A5M3MAT1_CONPW|nr:uncharacterized protein CONPUDRAFT_93215 [Coniophora puteana RWD-64-598 SS2]EIW75984.1 hypothetical protein CONPUDRAFT_93215 [Coniophora puteana RWD-64-598 SS2]
MKKSFKFRLPSNLQWIPANCTWPKWKPVIRCAMAMWVASLLFLIPRTENMMGQASFLILISSIMSPPEDPFIAVVEREFLIMSLTVLVWASWVCLGLKLSSLARRQIDTEAILSDIFAGSYVEAAPTVIIGVFIFLGIVFILFVRARRGPGPFIFATLYACISLDISFTTAFLFPYPYYTVTQVVFVPLALHSLVAITFAAILWPQTISSQFTGRLQAVIRPLATAMRQHRSMLESPPIGTDFDPSQVYTSVETAERSLAPLAASARLLGMDIIYGRFAPTDYRPIQDHFRRLTARANGMNMYFRLHDPNCETFPATPAPSRPSTPLPSMPSTPLTANSRASSVERSPTAGLGLLSPTEPQHNHEKGDTSAPNGHLSRQRSSHLSRMFSTSQSHSLHGPRHRRCHSHHPPNHHGHGSHNNSINGLNLHGNSHHRHHLSYRHLHRSLHDLLAGPSKEEIAVGVFESNRYMNIEAEHMNHPNREEYSARTFALLRECCDDLLKGCEKALDETANWLEHVYDNRFKFWRRNMKGRREERRRENVEKFEVMLQELARTIEEFKSSKRYNVIDPYRPLFETVDDSSSINLEYDAPPHRYLFHCYVYQYHLMEVAGILQEILKEIIRLEKTRKRNKLWVPIFKLIRPFSAWDTSDMLDDNEEDPDIIPGMKPQWMSDLGEVRRRDPDALPPSNWMEHIMNWIYRRALGFTGGNFLFALKAGVLTIILCLPSFLKSSAAFAYRNKFAWGIIMGQLTTARFRGDTAFGLVARIISTFCGGIVGTVIWYISTGLGRGNPYGLAAVFAVVFPFLFYARLYWPVPSMVNLVFFVTSMLVVGYSYQDEHLYTASAPGFGIDVAWRRFVLVTIGVVAAAIFSFLPPSCTIRAYQRRALATTAGELGGIYCSIVSYANVRRGTNVQQIVQSLIAIRAKLNRTIALKTNVGYEISLRGKWPAERYKKIVELQLEIAYLLSHLMSVVEHLEPAWSHAFLQRTRMLDSDFQGDVLAVISMITTSLKTGNPLPQITPCPLLHRYSHRQHGLNVVHEQSEEDYGLPRTLKLDTLENIQYLVFSVGVSTTFSIFLRLDRLMVAVKQLVGEQYHIHGVGAHHPGSSATSVRRADGSGIEMTPTPTMGSHLV